jgi:hypothetical protein
LFLKSISLTTFSLKMDNLVIEATKKTPEISFLTDGHLKLKGRSIPEDPSKFYDALYFWVFEYCSNPQTTTVVDVDLEYFNSGTSKSILHILRELVELHNRGHNVIFNWFYETGDDDIYERGEYYSSILDAKFNFIEIKQE